MKPPQTRLLHATGLFLVVALQVMRISAHWADYSHPDEIIAVEVLRGMLARPDLDSNWALAGGLPDMFRYPQYNFSGFHLLLAYLHSLAAALPWIGTECARWLTGLAGIRAVSLTWSVGALGLAWLVGSRLGGRIAGLCAALLVAASAQLFMDSLYARPESLVTAGSLGLLALALSSDQRFASDASRPAWAALAGAAFLTGFLVSVKVSMAPLGAVAVLMGLRHARAQATRHGSLWRSMAIAAGTLAVSGAIGFLAGAPAVPAHMEEYRFGIATLSKQYASAHFPHGLGAGSGWLERLRLGIWFLWASGAVPLVVLGLAGCVMLFLRRYWSSLMTAAVLIALLIYFLSTPVFFERNFSPSIALLAAMAGYPLARLLEWLLARRSWIATTGALLLLTGCAGASIWNSYLLRFDALNGHQRDRLARQEAEILARAPAIPVALMGPLGIDDRLDRAAGSLSGRLLLRYVDYGDPAASQARSHLGQAPHVETWERIRGTFSAWPSSTIHTYFDADVTYVRFGRVPGPGTVEFRVPADRPQRVASLPADLSDSIWTRSPVEDPQASGSLTWVSPATPGRDPTPLELGRHCQDISVAWKPDRPAPRQQIWFHITPESGGPGSVMRVPLLHLAAEWVWITLHVPKEAGCGFVRLELSPAGGASARTARIGLVSGARGRDDRG